MRCFHEGIPCNKVSLLDPTLKKIYLTECLLWEKDWVDIVMEHFITAFNYYKQKIIVMPTVSNDVSQESGGTIMLIEQHLRKKRCVNPTANGEEEYERYFNAPLAAENTDPLLFWQSNCFNYPVLSLMAKDYLTIQASSVPSERAFSSGTDLVTADRCSLSGKTIESTQFLKHHL